MKKIYKDDPDEVAEKALKSKSWKEAAKAFLIEEKKRQVEQDKLLTKESFQQELLKCDASRFNGTTFGGFWWQSLSYDDEETAITFSMLNEVKKAMRGTTAKVIGGLLEDFTTEEDASNIPAHVARIRDSSWTYAIAPSQDTDDPNELENLPDLDCIAINFARDKWSI